MADTVIPRSVPYSQPVFIFNSRWQSDAPVRPFAILTIKYNSFVIRIPSVKIFRPVNPDCSPWIFPCKIPAGFFYRADPLPLNTVRAKPMSQFHYYPALIAYHFRGKEMITVFKSDHSSPFKTIFITFSSKSSSCQNRPFITRNGFNGQSDISDFRWGILLIDITGAYYN